jgi:hypothetical protein
MIQDIYKSILSNGFTAKGQDLVNNKRLGIKRSFTNELGNYIEIYPEDYGFSVFIYGGKFMNGYFPWTCDILFKKDIDYLNEKMKTSLA